MFALCCQGPSNCARSNLQDLDESESLDRPQKSVDWSPLARRENRGTGLHASPKTSGWAKKMGKSFPAMGRFP